MPLCIVHLTPDKEIDGWFIATDTHDARRKASAIGAHDLASQMYGLEFVRSGKHELGGGFVMLVD